MDNESQQAKGKVFLSTSVVNKNIYAIGGQSDPHGIGVSWVEEYTPPR